MQSVQNFLLHYLQYYNLCTVTFFHSKNSLLHVVGLHYVLVNENGVVPMLPNQNKYLYLDFLF
jgi:hypothetical protein